MSPADRDDDIWGTGTESRNPFETDTQTKSRNDNVRQSADRGSERKGEARDRSRVNMSQGSWGDGTGSGWQDSSSGTWQNGSPAGSGWQNGSPYGGPQGGSGYGGPQNGGPAGSYGTNGPGGYRQGPPPNRQGGSTAGKVLLVIGIVLRSLIVVVSLVSLITQGIWFFSYSSSQSDSYEYSWSYDPDSDFDFDFGDGSYAFSDTDLQSEAERKDALDDSELEDTSDVVSEEEAAEITGSAVLGMNTSLTKPATAGQWVKTKKTIDGEAYDVYLRVKDMAPVDPSEIEEYNNSQDWIHLIPTNNDDFVDMVCTYEIYYPQGTPPDRHQKDFYSDIASKQGSFEMKDGTVYRDEELDEVFDITIDPPNSVTREGELFTGRLTYTVTKDCSEYYILWMDSDAGGRVYFRCTYEQGA